MSCLTSIEAEASETTGVTVLPSAALGLILLWAQHSGILIEPSENWRSATTEETAWGADGIEVGEKEIFAQINRVYDQLLNEKVELDSASKSALYANLWDLYT